MRCVSGSDPEGTRHGAGSWKTIRLLEPVNAAILERCRTFVHEICEAIWRLGFTVERQPPAEPEADWRVERIGVCMRAGYRLDSISECCCGRDPGPGRRARVSVQVWR